MSLLHSRFRRLAAATALVCFSTGIAAAAGAHTATVELALHQARAAASDLETERDRLAASLERAATVAGSAQAHTSTSTVADAVLALGSTVSAAASTAAAHEVEVRPAATAASFRFSLPADTGALLARPAGMAAEAEAEVEAEVEEPLPEIDTDSPVVEAGAVREVTVPDTAIASPEAVPSEDADDASSAFTADVTELPAVDEEPAADPLEDDSEIARVLSGEERDLDAVRRATAELEQAAAALDEAASQVAAVAEQVSDATAQVLVENAARGLDGLRIDARAAVVTAADVLDAVGDDVADESAPTAVETARAAVEEVLALPVDRDDSDDVAALADEVTDATAALTSAVEGLREAHLTWVDDENAEIDATNEALTAKYEKALAAAQDEVTEAYRAAVAAHQNGWTGAPPGVTYSNGQLPSSVLCPVPYATGHQLHCDAVRALMLADADYYAETGSHLTFTDSYRSYASQVATRAAKPATAAVPGTSNHGWGMALDFYPAAAAWMAANGADYGWVHPAWARIGGSKPESWHLEFVAPGVGGVDLPEAPELLERVVSALSDED